MPSTFSPLKIQLMATGENNTTWGDVTNLNLGTALEEAVVGSADVTFASADVTLTLTDTNASQTARNMRLRCTGTTGGSTRNLIVPSIEKPYIVKNDCADSVVVKTAAGTGITVPAGKTTWVYSDATNVVDATTHLSSLTLGTDLAVSDGGTGASTFTANGVIYGNTTSALLATAAGTTGQVLVGNTGAAPSWATLTGIGVTSFSAGTTGLTPSSATTGVVTLAGTLGVANGGTGTTTAFTAGSVVFAGASGVYSQDNANFFWDDTNNRLGIGTASPDNKLEVTVGDNAGINIEQASANQTGFFNFRDADGALAGRISYDHSNNSMRLATNETEKVRITSAGDVGIGTSTPSTKLDVVNSGVSQIQIQNTSGTTKNTQLMFADNVGSKWRIGMDVATNNNTNNFQLYSDTAGATAITVNTSLDVGIGTSSPSTKLDVLGVFRVRQSANAADVLGKSDNTGGLNLFGGGAFNAGAGVLIDGQSSASPDTIRFTRGAFSESMRINSSGNVGIGTASPGYKLQVNGTMAGVVASGANYEAIRTSDFYYMTVSADGLNTLTDANGSAPMLFKTGGTERMRIDSSGNVGIGTSSPQNGGVFGTVASIYGAASSALSIGNANRHYQWGVASSISNSLGLYDGTASAYRMVIDSSGNLIVGDTTSLFGSKMLIRTEASSNILSLFNATASGGAKIKFLDGANNAAIGNIGPDLAFYTAGDSIERMRIDSSGNLLVGRTSSSGLGQIQSTIGADLATDSGNVYLARGGGNVGIGTTTPAEKLSVAGAIRVHTNSSAGFTLDTKGGLFDFVPASNNVRVGYVPGTSGVNTGILTFVVGSGSEAMRIDSNGNVGIGTSSPISGYKLTMEGNGAYAALRCVTNAGFSTLSGFDGATQRWSIGQAGFGGNNGLGFYVGSGTEVGRFDASGNLLVGTTSTAPDAGVVMLSPAFTSSPRIRIGHTSGTADGNAYQEFFYAGSSIGSITQNGTTGVLYNTSSDVRLKHDIVDAPEASSLIDAIQVRSFKWNVDDSEQRYGFVAQELVTVAPEAVSQPEDPEEMMGVDYSKLVPMLVKEIQSLRARVAQLEGN